MSVSLVSWYNTLTTFSSPQNSPCLDRVLVLNPFCKFSNTLESCRNILEKQVMVLYLTGNCEGDEQRTTFEEYIRCSYCYNITAHYIVSLSFILQKYFVNHHKLMSL